MTNFLPEIVEAPEPEPPAEVFVEKPLEVEEEEDDNNDLDDKLSMNPKESVHNDMFEKVKIKEEDLSHIINDEPQPPVIVKPVKKPKKIISDKQRNALARNREILAQKRVAIANQKKEIKDRITKEEKAKGLPNDGGVKVKVDPKPEPQTPNVNVDEAVFNGIQRYETLRKARKVEKQKQREVDKKNEQLKSTIQNAVNGGHKPEANPFDQCFNFTF